MDSEKVTAIQDRPMEYQLANGDEMKLTINMVKRFLVRGRPELLSEQEVFYFMHVCKARRLNPFTNDCYLIKYSQDPAAIIVSVDYFRRNARKSKDCRGWAAGVITISQDNVLRYSNGIILPGERLIGGWFKAQPDGWSEPFFHEVPLEPFIKKTRDGHPTQFWRPENQPVMIRKVAECQGIRFLWGENTDGMYSPEEIVRDPDDIEMKQIGTGKPPANLYEPTQKAPETAVEQAKEPNRREPYAAWQQGQGKDESHGPDQRSDIASHNDNVDQGSDANPRDKEAKAVNEAAAPDQQSETGNQAPAELSQQVLDAIDTCKTEHVRKLYKGLMRNAIDTACGALGIVIDPKDYPAAHRAIYAYFKIEEPKPDEEPPPVVTSEFIDLLDKFNVAFTDAQKSPDELMPIFKAALNAANIPTGQRPTDELQARTFLSSYQNLIKSNRDAAAKSKPADTGMQKDAEIEDDHDKIWDELWGFLQLNYSSIGFHMFKNFLAIRSAQCGVPAHELAKQTYTSDEHCRETMTAFNKWRNVDGKF